MGKKVALLMGALGLVFSAASTVQAGALIEIRAGIGVTGSDPDDFNDQVGAGLKADSFENMNLDLYFNIPVLPFGVGIRNEWLSQDKSSAGSSWEIDATNLSLFADWRLINRTVFGGFIGGIGTPSGTYKDAGGSVDLKADSPTGFIGGEAGVKLGRFLFMGEIGYQSLRLKTKGGSTSVDLSGPYGRLMAGIGLF